MFLSESFFMTLATAISKSSCIRHMLLSAKLTASQATTAPMPWQVCESINGTSCETAAPE